MTWSAQTFARGTVVEALWQAASHHLTDAARPLRERLEAQCGDAFLLAHNVFAAPVSAEGQGFTVGGRHPRILIAVPNPWGEIEDLAAFAPDPPHSALRLTRRVNALGLHAWSDARLNEHFRLRIHADVWSWLRAQGQGLLPLDWQSVARECLERGVDGVVTSDVAQGRIVERRLSAALKPPPIFVTDDRDRDEAA